MYSLIIDIPLQLPVITVHNSVNDSLLSLNSGGTLGHGPDPGMFFQDSLFSVVLSVDNQKQNFLTTFRFVAIYAVKRLSLQLARPNNYRVMIQIANF